MISDFISKYGYSLVIVLIVGFTLIFAYIGLIHHITFVFDQARDAFEAYAIWHNGDIKVQGPSSDIPGVHHGVLWYYLLALPYALAKGDVFFTACFFFILAFLTVPVVGYLANQLFKNKTITLVSIILYVLSPLFLVFTRWLSNPVVAIYIAPFLLVALWKYIHQQKIVTALFIGILFGLLIQSNFAFGIFLYLVPVYYFSYRLRFRVMDISAFTGGLLLAVSTYFIAEIKFHGKATMAMVDFLSREGTSRSLQAVFFSFFNKIIELLSITLLPFNTWVIILILVLSAFFLIKRKDVLNKDKKPLMFLLIWLTNLIVFNFFNSGILTSSFIFAPSLVALIILGSYIIFAIARTSWWVVPIVTILAIFQITVSYTWLQENYSPLTIQQGLTWSYEKELIDYTYQQSNGEKFVINSITNPLYINTTWAYLYEVYGKNKYGYIPYWDGRSQVGYLGTLPIKKQDTKYRYLIIEPSTGIPTIYFAKIKYEEDRFSDIVEEKKFGNIIVQKRKLHKNKPPITIPAELQGTSILNE